MNAASKQVYLEIPSSDISLIEAIAQRMGWKLQKDKAADEITQQESAHIYSERINRIRSLKGVGITQAEIDSDERLKYLLNK